METVSAILVLLSVVAVAAAVLGLIQPRWVKVSSRGKAFFVYMLAACVMFGTGASFLPDPKSPPVAAGKVEEPAAPALASKDPQPVEDVTITREEMSLSIDEFLSRYNMAQKSLNNAVILVPGEKSNNGQQVSTKIISNTADVGFVLNANSKTEQIYDFTFVGRNDGSVESAQQLIFNLVALVMSLEDPQMPVDQRKGIVSDLGLNKGADMFQPREFTRGRYTYSMFYVETVGFTVVVQPAKA